MRSLEEGAFASKRVLVRIDADVPLAGTVPNMVLDDYRLQKLLPTLFYLINHRAKIILCGHLGRPFDKLKVAQSSVEGRPESKIVTHLSLKPVFEHLSTLVNKQILFAADPFSTSLPATISQLQEGEIIGLENLRFFKGEEDNSRTFARRLAKLADIYVNEAFATSHREDASLVAITEFLPSFAGLQLEREVEVLTQLTKHPAHPFLAVIGGAKIADKLPVIRRLLPSVDRILVGGAIANTFLASQGVDVQQSYVEPEFINQANQIYRLAKGKIILPSDYVWSNHQILDLGPISTAQNLLYIKKAQTILWSGVLGKIELPEFTKSSEAVARAIADSPATTIVGGGDTVGFIQKLNLTQRYTFVSTGGSALLELLGGRVLPGIRALR